MPSFHENPHSTNLALYPTMFPSTTWWNYKLPFMYWYCILDIIFLELVFPSFLVTSSWLEIMSLYSSYYFSSLNCRHFFFGTSLHSSLLVGDYVCDLSYKSNAIILETFHKEYLYWQHLCINIWSCNYFSQYNIHPYLIETF